jgi:hypothetical protein
MEIIMMFKKLVSKNLKIPQRGQALAEFALSAPILVMLLLGLIDFGVILFSYSQASNSLREALRYAEILGASGDPEDIPYLDCQGMRNAAKKSFFAADHDVDLLYVKASEVPEGEDETKGCDPAKKEEINDWLENGDILRIKLTAKVDPFFIPIDTLDIEFSGQRSIVKALPITIEGGFGVGGEEGDDDSTGDDSDDDGMIDGDTDGVDDSVDNCLTVPNPDQANSDGDSFGDLCDNCPYTDNEDQADTDGDAWGNVCDNCPFDENPDQLDTDSNGIGNVCDAGSVDDDEDGIPNDEDNCPNTKNADQADADNDLVGNACDNCPLDSNTNQADADHDGIGDVCDDDSIAPPAPQGFQAYTPDCSTGEVWFAWQPMSPIPTRMEIVYDQCDTDFSNDVVVEEMNDVPPSLVTNSFCQNCDSIDPVTGFKCYYAVAYNGTNPEYQGPNSNVSTVNCLQPPPTPINFAVNAECSTGNVSFTWAYTVSAPTTVTIESTDGTFSTTLPSSETSCPNCDNLPGGIRSYYIYATNGIAPNSKDSDPSSIKPVSCPSPTTGTIEGTLFKAQNGASQVCTSSGPVSASGEPVKLLTSPGGSKLDEIALSGSTFTFENVEAGTYYLDVPGTVGGLSKVSDDASGTCVGIGATRLTVTVTAGGTTAVAVGYY